MNETTFSRWLCQQFISKGLFPQRLEVTTGAGVPDIALLGPTSLEPLTHKPYSRTNHTCWIELKWKTRHIRPEQYVWGKKAEEVGCTVNYIVGYEKSISIFSLSKAEKMTISWKLVTEIKRLPRNKESISELIPLLK